MSSVTDFGFTSQRSEKSFGLMDYNARYYSPVLGRFISPDSLVPDPSSSGGFNRYAYVNNNPFNHTDPSGHCPPSVCNGEELERDPYYDPKYELHKMDEGVEVGEGFSTSSNSYANIYHLDKNQANNLPFDLVEGEVLPSSRANKAANAVLDEAMSVPVKVAGRELAFPLDKISDALTYNRDTAISEVARMVSEFNSTQLENTGRAQPINIVIISHVGGKGTGLNTTAVFATSADMTEVSSQGVFMNNNHAQYIHSTLETKAGNGFSNANFQFAPVVSAPWKPQFQPRP